MLAWYAEVVELALALFQYVTLPDLGWWQALNHLVDMLLHLGDAH